MGMTIIGIGNSSVDLLVTVQLSHDGNEIMALSGIMGGQLFNLLIGFGLSLIFR